MCTRTPQPGEQVRAMTGELLTVAVGDQFYQGYDYITQTARMSLERAGRRYQLKLRTCERCGERTVAP